MYFVYLCPLWHFVFSFCIYIRHPDTLKMLIRRRERDRHKRQRVQATRRKEKGNETRPNRQRTKADGRKPHRDQIGSERAPQPLAPLHLVGSCSCQYIIERLHPLLKCNAKVLLFSHIRKRAQEKNTKKRKKVLFVRFFFVGVADLRENRRYSDFSTNRVRRTHNRT